MYSISQFQTRISSPNCIAGKTRRKTADFPGADVILKQLKEKPLKKRVGFLSAGPPARSK